MECTSKYRQLNEVWSLFPIRPDHFWITSTDFGLVIADFGLFFFFFDLGHGTFRSLCPRAKDKHRMPKLGFFNTVKYGGEDNLTLFSRQTPPVSGKNAEKHL